MKYIEPNKSAWVHIDEFIPKYSTHDNYRQMKSRGDICVRLDGGGIWIEFESMPPRYRARIEEACGPIGAYIQAQRLKTLVVRNEAARKYYVEQYELPCGDLLPVKYQMKYGRSCDWLEAIKQTLANKQGTKEYLGMSIDEVWTAYSRLINNDDVEEHDLPSSVDRLQRRYRLYRDKGYGGIVEAWRFGNDHRRKVTPKIEGLMLALYRIKHKPTLLEVMRYYNEFMAGELEVIDMESAEVYNPKDFCNDGKTFSLSKSTVSYYLTTPKNRAIIDKERMSALEYNNTYRPHMMRTGPVYAFSKVTMDDTSSPFKMLNGDRPATYKMFDVASTALIGMVMHDQKRPDAALIRSLLMGVIGLIAKRGWKMPAEIEMERAITSTMAGDEVTKDVLSAGAVFPYTRWCKAKNPQEKRAEGFIKQIKYGYQKHRDGFQYRPFAKRTENKSNEDAKDVLFSFQDIYSMEMEDMMLYNNALHPNQKLHPNMTRWQVLEQCQNPSLPVADLRQVMPYVGYKTKTSVSRMRVQVQYQKYNLPDAAVLGSLDGPDLMAYYIPEDNGEIPTVYLYQDGRFICEASMEDRFQEAKVEQTDKDMRIMGKQKAYEAGFDKLVETGLEGLDKVAVIKKNDFPIAIGTQLLNDSMPVEAVGVEVNNDSMTQLLNDSMDGEDVEEQVVSRANRMF